jgi:tetratricopeptide (TPR) repeat protein
LLTLFVSIEGLKHSEKSFDLEFFLVTLRKNIFNGSNAHSGKTSQVMPIAFAIILWAIVGTVGYFAVRYIAADMLFAQSLVAASNNNGGQTYQKQVAAITMFPYRDGFYRIFSQTNISIANSILALNNSNPKKNDQSTQQVQNTALNLIQQGITVARSATSISPLTTVNWQNVGSIYRSLIGFGQGAENFAIAAMQQAIVLDPTNPQEYITLGGLYYQLGQYDNAIRQFQTAVNLKQDYANAYYNLGHAYEQKQDYANALSNYQIVKQLMANDKANSDKISAEIDALQKKTNTATKQTQQTPVSNTTQTTQQEPLNLASPQTQFPAQPTQVPLTSPTPTQ